MGIDKRTFERWRKNPDGDRRRGPLSSPANKLNEQERAEVVRVANSTEFCDKSPTQIVPALADRGQYVASESSFYRILKAEGMTAHRGRSKPRTHKRPKELVATGPNQVHSWDITFLRTTVTGVFLYLYFVMDIYSRKIVGYAVHPEQSAEHASRLIDAVCKDEGIVRDQLTLHSDNGSPMKGATMLSTLQRLGVMPSFSRPSVSDDNPFSEALFKTAKYCPLYPCKPFEGVDEALAWIKDFVSWYNNQHLHSGIKFVTPSSRHNGDDKTILAQRKIVYETAKAQKPERWSGSTRNWDYIKQVALNSLKEKVRTCSNIAA
jgi:transposase InsO family protein